MATILRDGIEVYHERWPGGAGDAPVFLIPGLGSNAAHFGALVDDLRRSHEVLSIDNRGAGRTPVPARPFSVADMADDVAAVLDREAIDDVHVVGTSMGGMVAQELVLRHPARVRTLALVCTSCGGTQAVTPSREVSSVLLAIRGRNPEVLVETLGPILFAPATPRAERLRFFVERSQLAPTPAGFLAQFQAILGLATHDRLGQVRAPTLVIHGAEDVLVPTANADVLDRAIPGARKVILPGGHVFFAEHREEFVRRLLAFWEAVRSDRRGAASQDAPAA